MKNVWNSFNKKYPFLLKPIISFKIPALSKSSIVLSKENNPNDLPEKRVKKNNEQKEKGHVERDLLVSTPKRLVHTKLIKVING